MSKCLFFLCSSVTLQHFACIVHSLVKLATRSVVFCFCRKEIKEGAEILLTKIRKFKPKIAVFNGKGRKYSVCSMSNSILYLFLSILILLGRL